MCANAMSWYPANILRIHNIISSIINIREARLIIILARINSSYNTYSRNIYK